MVDSRAVRVSLNSDAHKSLGTKVTRAWLVKVLVDAPSEKKNHPGFATGYIRGPEGTALDLELSVYRDPLCFMHWNDIYLLYVRKGGKRVQTLERVNYEGMQ